MGFFLFVIISLCGVCADEVLVQINVNRPLNVISDRFLSFSVDPRIVIENLNRNNSEELSKFASHMSHAYLKLSMVPLPKIIQNCDKMASMQEEELRNWRIFNEWLKSMDWVPVVPLPYNPTDWKSLAALRILNASITSGVENCVWQLGSDFDAVGAGAYVADLITLQTMVDAFKMDGWGVIGADISAGSDTEETKLYSDLTKHIVEAVGWIQHTERYIPETQNSIVYDNDLALKALLGRETPVWLSISSNLNRRTEIWPGISTADGVQWARTLGDAARTGFDVIYRTLNAEDLFEENLSYFSSLLFKQLMGNKVFDAKVITGNRFISYAYCHCTKDKPGALSIMAVNIGDTRNKIAIKMTSKHTGAELWQYVLTSRNKTTYLNGEEVYFNSTMEPFIKVKHPTRPISVVLPPMSIGFWVLPLAESKECLEYAEKADERKKYLRVRTSSDLLLQHLIKENALSKTRDSLQQVEEIPTNSNPTQNIMKPATSDYEFTPNASKRDKPKKNQNTKQSETVISQKEQSRRKRELGNAQKPVTTKSDITHVLNYHQIPSFTTSKLYSEPAKKNSFTNVVSFPSEDLYFNVLNGPEASQHIYDDAGHKAEPHTESWEVNEDRTNHHIPDIFYEIYHIRQKVPKHHMDIDRESSILQQNYQNHINLQRMQTHSYSEPINELSPKELRKILKRTVLHSRPRRDMTKQAWNPRKAEVMRNRRSPIYKTISMTNFISKDMEDDSPPNRKYLTYALNQNFVRPVNFEDVQWQDNVVPETDTYDDKNLIDKYEEGNSNNEEIKNTTESSTDEHTPKFMMLMSENVSKFMKMLNHHVSGWWNTWA